MRLPRVTSGMQTGLTFSTSKDYRRGGDQPARMSRIVSCRLDRVIGDVVGNTELVAAAITEAVASGADAIGSLEPAMSGHPLA